MNSYQMKPEEILELLPCDYCKPFLTDMTSGPVHQECRVAWMYRNFSTPPNRAVSEKTIIKSIKQKLRANPNYFSDPAHGPVAETL